MGKKIAKLEWLEARRLFTDVSQGFVDKEEQYEQTGPSTVVEASGANGSPFNFYAVVELNSGGSVSSASEQLQPSGATNDLTLSSSGTFLEYTQAFSSLSALNAAFPDGTYDLKIDAVHDGDKTLSVDLAGDEYPDAPTTTDYDALQDLDPTQAQTITWEPFSNGTASNIIDVIITDISSGNVVFKTPSTPGASGALDGTATSTVVPGGTLSPGQTYDVTIEFNKGVAEDTSGYPGAPGFAVYTATTNFTISTLGASNNDGALVVTGGSGNDTIGIVNSGGNYVVTTDDVTPQDFPVADINSIEVLGGAGNDSITIDPSVTLATTLRGAGGNDTLSGGSGADLIRGGTGNDVESGNAGADTIIGGEGDDSITGGAGSDSLLGGADNDTLLGGGGADTLDAGIGDNSLSGGAGNDSLYSVNGTPDTLNGGAGTNIAQYDVGIDTVLNVQSPP